MVDAPDGGEVSPVKSAVAIGVLASVYECAQHFHYTLMVVTGGRDPQTFESAPLSSVEIAENALAARIARLVSDDGGTEVEAEYLVWSDEHNAWWAPDECGYVVKVADAGRYSATTAARIISGDVLKTERLVPAAGAVDGKWPAENVGKYPL